MMVHAYIIIYLRGRNWESAELKGFGLQCTQIKYSNIVLRSYKEILHQTGKNAKEDTSTQP